MVYSYLFHVASSFNAIEKIALLQPLFQGTTGVTT